MVLRGPRSQRCLGCPSRLPVRWMGPLRRGTVWTHASTSARELPERGLPKSTWGSPGGRWGCGIGEGAFPFPIGSISPGVRRGCRRLFPGIAGPWHAPGLLASVKSFQDGLLATWRPTRADVYRVSGHHSRRLLGVDPRSEPRPSSPPPVGPLTWVLQDRDLPGLGTGWRLSGSEQEGSQSAKTPPSDYMHPYSRLALATVLWTAIACAEPPLQADAGRARLVELLAIDSVRRSAINYGARAHACHIVAADRGRRIRHRGRVGGSSRHSRWNAVARWRQLELDR